MSNGTALLIRTFRPEARPEQLDWVTPTVFRPFGRGRVRPNFLVGQCALNWAAEFHSDRACEVDGRAVGVMLYLNARLLKGSGCWTPPNI